ncbi:hypothetical protein [Gordonibacter sp.]|nr:hypothetical protein [Gordonibacter sp.]
MAFRLLGYEYDRVINNFDILTLRAAQVARYDFDALPHDSTTFSPQFGQ